MSNEGQERYNNFFLTISEMTYSNWLYRLGTFIITSTLCSFLVYCDDGFLEYEHNVGSVFESKPGKQSEENL